MTTSSIHPHDLSDRLRTQTRIDLIDVRTPAEFRELHIDAARNVPLDQLNPADVMQNRAGSADEPLYVICQSGNRGRQACMEFEKDGFPNVRNVEGGKKTMSLERQVRIAAGTLVLMRLALSFVHPACLGLSAVVGAGLVFADITDTCGTGMLLPRMPWNRSYGDCC